MAETFQAQRSSKLFWRWWLVLPAIYLALLLASFAHRAALPAPQLVLLPNQSAVTVPEIRNGVTTGREIRMAYLDYPATRPGNAAEGASSGTETYPIVLVHGSPGSGDDLRKLADALRGKRRILAPDMPGFANSEHDIADYSIRAHALYLLELLDQLGVRKVHLVSHSMGGGVVLNFAQVAPDRVASITMVSSIGVQEQELLGDYHANHIVHGAQLFALRVLRGGIPRFGSWTYSDMGVPYARNFYDSDQRPLRDILHSYAGPMLIEHGTRDPLVPVEAAYEHARLVPQSALYIYDGDHFTVFTNPGQVAAQILPFLDAVDNGRALTRRSANPARLQAAALPMDHSRRPKMLPVTVFVLFFALALSTLVSEDLACISAGLLVSDGRAPFLLVTLACFTGIFLGDILLFLIGKVVGRKALRLTPVRWLISEQRLERSSKWLERNGAAVIFTSRFVPGTRLPTYLAAGLLHKHSLRFVFYFLLSCAVWTPLLVGSAAGLFTPLLRYGLMADKSFGLKLIVAVLVFLVLLRLAVKAVTFGGRRGLVGWFYRKIRWEFWPPWIFYPPVFFYVLYLGFKHKGLTTFTASNPGIVAGGFVGESKYHILRSLSAAGDAVLRFTLIPTGEPEERVNSAKEFMTQNRLTWPVVLKPDAGQRGSGVAVVRTEEQLTEYLTQRNYDTILQEYASGLEFGVFYYRYPGEANGHIFSITLKQLPVLTGDGQQTLEHLILSDNRAVCMADFYFAKNAERLNQVLASGETIQLVELGTHCRGAIFLDGSAAITAELTQAIDAISKHFPGFYFGRYDVRAASVEDLKAGVRFKVIELNGVSSEATHIYDPKLSLLQAYGVLFRQWRIAYEIGSENRLRGAKITSVRGLLKLMAHYRETSRGHGE